MAAKPILEDLPRIARLPRNLVLAERPGAPLQDLRDCAGLLSKMGLEDAARRLFHVADFVGGVAKTEGPSTRCGGSTWDIAVEELSALMAVAEDDPEVSSSETATTRILIQGAFDASAIDLTALPPEPSTLAMAVAFNVMRRALVRRADLFRPPYGGAALFQNVQALGPIGLGAGFQNIGVLVPTWSGVDTLIAEAWRKAPRRTDLPATLDRFGLLLSIGFSADDLRWLVDELADGGRTSILQGLLARLLGEPPNLVDHELLRALRDAFLDLGDLARGLEAQRCLTEATGQAPAEQVAQSELEASLHNQSSTDPAREVQRRRGFASTAAQRARRFAFAARP